MEDSDLDRKVEMVVSLTINDVDELKLGGHFYFDHLQFLANGEGIHSLYNLYLKRAVQADKSPAFGVD